MWVVMVDVHGLPFLLAETLRVARAVDNGAEQVEALTTFSLATPMLAEARTPAVPTGVLLLSMLANSLATTILALVLLLSMLADRGATTLLALVLPFPVSADRYAATFNTTLAPLQMHTFDDRHSGSQRVGHKSKCD